MQNKGQTNVKRGVNSAAKPWTQFNYNIAFEINVKLLPLICTDIIYYLRYNTLITENEDM